MTPQQRNKAEQLLKEGAALSMRAAEEMNSSGQGKQAEESTPALCLDLAELRRMAK